MRINVKSLQGDEYIVDVHPDHLVSDLKALISEKTAGAVPITKQKLIFKGRTMQDGSQVSNYHLEDGCKVHLILQKDKPTSAYLDASSSNTDETIANNQQHDEHTNIFNHPDLLSADKKTKKQSAELKNKFEEILRERLVKLFPSAAVDKIMAELDSEINNEMNSSSIDDLELLAKGKLNISKE